jgi:YegS/Rv2252/BmrU family lipid kinase
MFYFIINPNSGHKKAGEVWNKLQPILDKENIKHEFAMTEYEGHATSIAEMAIKNGFREIICVGGDGTINEIVNGIMTSGVEEAKSATIGMLPTGTGNDWCRIHKIPNKTEEAFEIIRKGKTAIQDIGKITFGNNGENIRYFVNVAGAGFDGVVAKNVNIDKKAGKEGIILFAKNLLATLFKSEINNCKITIDEDIIEGKMFSIAVGIGKYNGGGMMQLPAAVHDDGLLDVTVIGNISKFDVLRYVPLLFNGKFIRHPKVFTYRCKEIKVESEHKLLVEAEGEVAGTLPIIVEIIPSALRVYSGL